MNKTKPAYYIGDGDLKHTPINKVDIFRHGNGVAAGKRDKAARRMLRKKLKRSRSSIEKKVDYAHTLNFQARDLADNSHEAKRLREEEAATHEPVVLVEKPKAPIRAVQEHIARAAAKPMEIIIEGGDKEAGRL